MIKVIVLIVLFIYTLQARENPFFFESNLKQLPYTSNADKNLPPLKRAAITLPSKARTIEKVVVTYKILDGSIEEKSITLGNSIDWHLPIFISQNYVISESNKKVFIKNKKPILKKNTKYTNSIDVNPTKFIKIAKRQYITFLSSNKTLKLITKSKKIRDFLLVKPHRIVIDFKKRLEILAYVKKNPKKIKDASKYLDIKLSELKQPYKNIYIIEKKKESFFSRLINSILKI